MDGLSSIHFWDYLNFFNFAEPHILANLFQLLFHLLQPVPCFPQFGAVTGRQGKCLRGAEVSHLSKILISSCSLLVPIIRPNGRKYTFMFPCFSDEHPNTLKSCEVFLFALKTFKLSIGVNTSERKSGTKWMKKRERTSTRDEIHTKDAI